MLYLYIHSNLPLANLQFFLGFVAATSRLPAQIFNP